MKVVKETKIPTIKQMTAIAHNLREKLSCHVEVSVSINAYEIGKYGPPTTSYNLYTSKKYNGESIRNFSTWRGLLTSYNIIIST